MPAICRSRPVCSAAILVLVFVICLGCGSDSGSPASQTGAKPGKAPGQGALKSARPVVELDQAEKQAFADRLIGATESGDTRTFNACIDWNGIIEKATAALIDDKQKAKDFHRGAMQGFRSTLDAPHSFAGQVIANTQTANGRYELLRFHERNGHPYALFRLSGDDGLNYHDMRLGRLGGRVVATDILPYLTGEHLTETFRRTFMPAVQQISKSWVQKLAGSDKAFFDNYARVGELSNLVNAGRGEEALRVYEQLPPSLKTLKLVLIQRYHAAGLVGDQAIIDAIEAFEKAYPGDPALPLISIDAHILRRRFDKAYEAIDTLDRAVGGDPYLDFMRASIALEEENPQKAAEYARNLVEARPCAEDYRELLVGVLLMAEDNAAIYQAMNDWEADFEVEWEDLRTVPEYAGFVASKEGTTWLAEHGYTESPASYDPSPPVREPLDLEPEQPADMAVSPFGRPQGMKTWTDATGKFSVEAEFVAFDPSKGSVRLKKEDGKEISVPLAKLSAESAAEAMQAYARQEHERLLNR